MADVLEPLERLTDMFRKLDGVGKKSAARYAFCVLNFSDEEADEELLDESYFTETLAKIYIKQRKYSRALEIIRSLYLKYPEKNVYFADQIRFLEKLIINNNSK